jgi:WbqC-like protein family
MITTRRHISKTITPPCVEDTPKTAVVIQPCFFPWRGQFDLMSRADTVVFLDTVQFVRHSWYNRNRIMTANGPVWITVPVKSTGDLSSRILDIEIAERKPWQRKMLSTVEQAYARYPYADTYRQPLRDLLLRDWRSVSKLAQASVEWVFDRIGSAPKFVKASELTTDSNDAVIRLIEICREIGATRYLSGPSASGYVGQGDAFVNAGIELVWMEYDYPDYPQVRPCESPLSIIDLLFNVGDDAPRYIWD